MGGHIGVSRTRAILAERHRAVLRRSARGNLLLAFDYDGTLAPIAPTPERARMPVRTGRLLTRVAALYPCAVISGRSLADVSARVAGIGVRHIFGNHGLEESGVRARPHPHVMSWLGPLRASLADAPGVVIEDKGLSISVHYRAAKDHRQALATILAVTRRLPHVRIITGAAAINLLPRRGVDKGVALRRALALTSSSSAIYVGDDDTDEDAFAALGPDQLLGIRVGRSATSRARYHLESQRCIDRLLEILIEFRR
jgi:trehalose 6-phosphate phosphatase